MTSLILNNWPQGVKCGDRNDGSGPDIHQNDQNSQKDHKIQRKTTCMNLSFKIYSKFAAAIIMLYEFHYFCTSKRTIVLFSYDCCQKIIASFQGRNR